MAKLGMPSVTISFIEAGIEAIERSQRGIVALLLEEPQETITKLLTDHEIQDGEQRQRSRLLKTLGRYIPQMISRQN